MIVAQARHELAALHGPLAVSVGVFDGVHRGHQAVFEELRRVAGDAMQSLVVTLNPHPAEVLRPGARLALLTTPAERARLLEEATHPDAYLVHRFDRDVAGLPAADFLRGLVPEGCQLRALVVGHDFRMGKDRSGGFEELTAIGRQEGFRVIRVPAVAEGRAPVSSTRIRALVAEGRLPEAAELLGHPYLVIGRVVPGHGRGRLLEFPTANVEVEDGRKLLPELGVYAVRVRLPGRRDGERLPAVLNHGVRPTFGAPDPALEVHIPGFQGGLVGEELGLDMIRRIRGERRFPSPQALAARIAQDVEEARRILGGRWRANRGLSRPGSSDRFPG